MRDTSKAALVVGVTGFEPATTWSQTRCATGLRYAPFAPQSYAFFAKCARHRRPRRAYAPACLMKKSYLCGALGG